MNFGKYTINITSTEGLIKIPVSMENLRGPTGDKGKEGPKGQIGDYYNTIIESELSYDKTPDLNAAVSVEIIEDGDVYKTNFDFSGLDKTKRVVTTIMNVNFSRTEEGQTIGQNSLTMVFYGPKGIDLSSITKLAQAIGNKTLSARGIVWNTNVDSSGYPEYALITKVTANDNSVVVHYLQNDVENFFTISANNAIIKYWWLY